MENTSKRPVEIFDFKGSFGLFQIAYLGADEYYLYKTYSPWYGVFNFIPNMAISRNAQKIDKKVSQKYAFRKDKEYYQKGQSIRVSMAMIVTAMLSVLSTTVEFILKSKILVCMVVIAAILCWILKTFLQYKIALRENKILQDYSPTVKIKLYSTYLPGRLVILILLAFLLIPNQEIKLFVIALDSFFLVPYLYNFFPDIKKLEDTNNKIKIITCD